MIARRCCCSAISVLFQTTRPRSVLVSHKQKNSSLLSSIDRSHFFFFVFFFFERFFLYQNREKTTVLQKPFFSSVPFSRNHTSSIDCCFVCSRQKKKKIFRLKICPRGLPLLFAAATYIQNQRKSLCVLWCRNFWFSLLHKIKTSQGVLFNTRTRTVSSKRNVFG